MKKVLITGIDGFTGVYLEDLLLKSGYAVYGLVYPQSKKDTHIVCNIAKKEEITAALKTAMPDYIVHLAGISFVPHSDIKQIYDINFFGTLNILDVLLELDLLSTRVVLASSANVYGNPETPVLDESICPQPVNHYATSKLSMELLARTYFDRLSILITRPFNYTGVGQGNHFLIPKIVDHYRKGKKEIELGNLDVVRDFSDVRYVVDVYKRLMECGNKSEIVNICSGQGVSLMEILGKMNDLAGYVISPKINPEFVRTNEVKSLIGSYAKLRNLVGNVKIYPLGETLAWMFKSG